jgi:hypothetical protein
MFDGVVHVLSAKIRLDTCCIHILFVLIFVSKPHRVS